MAKRRGRRNLRAQGVQPVAWRDAVDGRAPRLGPGEYIGTDLVRSGRFASKDPLRTGRLWSVWSLVGFLGWASMLGGALAAARRRVRGSN